MEITSTALIVIGCIAAVLLIAVILVLCRYYKQWSGANEPKYHALRMGDDETKAAPRSFQPKFTAPFPTYALPTQFMETGLDDYLEDKDEFRRGLEHPLFQQQQQQQQQQYEQQEQQHGKVSDRTYDREVREMPIKRPTVRKVFSDSDISVVQADTRLEKHRAKSEQEMGTLNTPKRGRARSALQVVPEISGQLEYSVLLNTVKKVLEINLVQIIDVNEISPEMFKDNFPVFDINEVPSGEKTPHLLRGRNMQMTFSDPEQLGFCVEVMKFPRKEHLCTTDYKFGMRNTTLNETYTSEFADSEQLRNSLIRLQVLLRYGRQPQRPTILGESLLPLKKCDDGVWSLFRDDLKFPVNETELEAMAMEYSSIGKMVVSVRYQLLNHQLTVRICEVIFNNRLGIQSPNTSVKVGVYHNDCCVFKEATEVIKRTLNPQFQKSFDFKFAHEKLQNAAILVEVLQHGYLQKSILGYVHIGLKASRRGRNYWKEVIGFSDFNTECILDIQTVKPLKVC